MSKLYYGAKPLPKGYQYASAEQAKKKGQVRYWGIREIDKKDLDMKIQKVIKAIEKIKHIPKEEIKIDHRKKIAEMVNDALNKAKELDEEIERQDVNLKELIQKASIKTEIKKKKKKKKSKMPKNDKEALEYFNKHTKFDSVDYRNDDPLFNKLSRNNQMEVLNNDIEELESRMADLDPDDEEEAEEHENLENAREEAERLLSIINSEG